MWKTHGNVITVFPSFSVNLAYRGNMKKVRYTFYPSFMNRTYQFFKKYSVYVYARERGQRHLIHTSACIHSLHIYIIYVQSLNYSHIFHLCAHSTVTLSAMQQSLLYSTASLMQHESYEGKRCTRPAKKRNWSITKRELF